MHYKINQVDIELMADEDATEFLADKDLIGKPFKDEDEMNEYVGFFERQYNVNIDSLMYEICTTELEDKEEWDWMIADAMEEAEATGRSFDHIMGEHLAGIH